MWHSTMKKALLLLVALCLSLSLVQPYKVEAALRIYTTTRDTQYVEGIRHIKFDAEIDYNGVISEQVIDPTDTIVVQQSMTGIFDGVRDAIGGWEILVKDGMPVTTFTEGASYQFRAPRTVVGIKKRWHRIHLL